MFWVGRVYFELLDTGKVRCAVCGAKIAPDKAAQHALRRHKSASEGVLAGQMGLPFTETPDVPPRASRGP